MVISRGARAKWFHGSPNRHATCELKSAKCSFGVVFYGFGGGEIRGLMAEPLTS